MRMSCLCQAVGIQQRVTVAKKHQSNIFIILNLKKKTWTEHLGALWACTLPLELQAQESGDDFHSDQRFYLWSLKMCSSIVHTSWHRLTLILPYFYNSVKSHRARRSTPANEKCDKLNLVLLLTAGTRWIWTHPMRLLFFFFLIENAKQLFDQWLYRL